MKNHTRKQNYSFSILMANYNNSKYLKEAINSLISQTYLNWELIIVDDCSTDNSIEIINLFLKDKRIRLIRSNRNLGYGGALKTASDAAINEILAILDPDDKLHEKALEIMARAYRENSAYGFIYSTMWSCDSELKNCKIVKWIGPDIPEKTNIFVPKISHFKTFRKDVYEKTSGYDLSQKRSVDKDIIYKLEEVTKFKFVDVPLYYYRQHVSGISQGQNKFQARVYLYIAKCKAYHRRLNTDIPNVTLNYLYNEYYKITFHSLIKLGKFINNVFNISNLSTKILKKYPRLNSVNFRKFNFLKKISLN